MYAICRIFYVKTSIYMLKSKQCPTSQNGYFKFLSTMSRFQSTLLGAFCTLMKWKPARAFDTVSFKLDQRLLMSSDGPASIVLFSLSAFAQSLLVWGWEKHLKSACFVLVGGELLWLTNTRIHNYNTNTKYKETITNTQSQLSGPEERLLCGGGLGATLLAEAPSSKSRLSWSLSWLL